MSWIHLRAICSLDFALPSKIYPEIDVKQIKLCFPLLFHKRSHHTDYHSNIHLSTVCFNQMLKGFCQKYRPQPKKVEKNRWGSKLLAGMKPNQKKKGTSPGQLKLFWDELDITNEEIIKAATIFVKANCYTPNPKNK
ncbi:hypothetical protein CEP14_10645 [Cylindrospermopsis raciborskii C04]|nr:hypothetical protein [Cylindrospermopsis raciborskii]PNJ90413.1 hypothetical protein CEP13_19175 [Cylindrospermopsis raciborskii C03]PNJ94497.1 hypothetical protein CEP14_10645 [Cylindrospermopsis raciborskii C04]PNJ95195.1 hypothetical protein CEP15_12060 [Cylindrospermopsis raciborskii C07]